MPTSMDYPSPSLTIKNRDSIARYESVRVNAANLVQLYAIKMLKDIA